MINWNVLYRPMIGQAWTGRHVVILHCSLSNELINFYKSDHAPMEPLVPSCTESLSRLLSIGYKIATVTPLPQQQIQYILVLE